MTAITTKTETGSQLTKTAGSTAKEMRLGGISGSEAKFLAFFTLILCVVSSLPYAVGHAVSFPGTVFTDILEHSYDTGNYLAYANQAAHGRWLFSNPMTSEPHRAVFFNLEWQVIGKLSALLHVSLASGTNILRLLSLGLMCWAVYWLSTFLFVTPFMRGISLVSAMAGGGFGWLAALHLLHIPIDSSYFLDLSNANFFPFYWALKLPHFLVSEAWVTLGFCFFLLAERKHLAGYYVVTGVCYIAAGACRPYDMFFAMVATSVYLVLYSWEDGQLNSRILLHAIPVFMCVPVLGYYFWIFKIHPIFKWWSLPGRPGPSAWILALGFGISFCLLPFSLWRLRRCGLTDAGRFLLGCMLTAVVLAYAHFLFHFSFQFATNILVPLVLIVLAGLEAPITRWREHQRWAGVYIAGLLILNSATSIALTGQAVMLVARGDFRADAQLLEGYSWLDKHAPTDAVVLADFDNSNQIPQYTHNRVFCGYLNAVEFDEKSKQQERFLGAEARNGFRAQLISQNDIQFVLLTASEEQKLKPLSGVLFTREVFRNNAAVIFQVGTAENGAP